MSLHKRKFRLISDQSHDEEKTEEDSPEVLPLACARMHRGAWCLQRHEDEEDEKDNSPPEVLPLLHVHVSRHTVSTKATHSRIISDWTLCMSCSPRSPYTLQSGLQPSPHRPERGNFRTHTAPSFTSRAAQGDYQSLANPSRTASVIIPLMCLCSSHAHLGRCATYMHIGFAKKTLASRGH